MQSRSAVSSAFLPFLLVLVVAAPLRAQGQTLTVVTKPAAPFVMQAGDGAYSGLCIDLWEKVAQRLDLRFRYQTRTLPEMLDALRSERPERRADVAIGALTITSEREARMDFSHPFLSSGLGIAVGAAGEVGWWSIVRGFLSVQLLQAVGALAFVLLVCGALVWILERRKNPEQFGGGSLRGLGEGFWWAAVTMTTVGYGDRAPLTVGGRLVALVWMFASIIIISSYTAAIASALTVGQLAGRIDGPEDLPGVRIATVAGSASEGWLRQRGLVASEFPDLPAAMDALVGDKVEAVIYDAPMLSYLAGSRYAGRVVVLPHVLRRESYAFGLRERSPLREQLNRALLEILDGPEWEGLVQRYLGR